MSKYEHLTVAELAEQHQLLIDMILQTLAGVGADNPQKMAVSIEALAAALSAAGRDATILTEAASRLRARP